MIDLSPEEFRQLGYHAIDIIAQRLASNAVAPVRRPVPQDVQDALMHAPLPIDGTDPMALLERLEELILPYPMGNGSPRFFAWVNSPPAPMGVLAELLAAAHDPSVAGGDHAATYVEHGVLNWIKSIMRFPVERGAVLTSGGSVASLVPLAVMRFKKAHGNIRTQGYSGETAPMVIYTSMQGHSCIHIM